MERWKSDDLLLLLDHSKPHLVKNPNCQNGKLDAAEVEDVVVSDMLKLSKEYEVIEEKSEQQNQKGFEAMNQRKTVLEGKLKSLYNLYASDTNNNVLLETIGEINKELENLKAVDPNNMTAYMSLALLYENEGNPTKAITLYRELLAKSPENWAQAAFPSIFCKSRRFC